MPSHHATLGMHAVELAAEAADGIMPTMWSPERTERSRESIARGRHRAP
ncbi:hypothetical protein ACQP04_20500 [Pseudonocardia halophobica]